VITPSSFLYQELQELVQTVPLRSFLNRAMQRSCALDVGSIISIFLFMIISLMHLTAKLTWLMNRVFVEKKRVNQVVFFFFKKKSIIGNKTYVSITKTTELWPNIVVGPSRKNKLGKPWIMVDLYN
jgi:hypothetical protein